jgi:hypothetical protein
MTKREYKSVVRRIEGEYPGTRVTAVRQTPDGQVIVDGVWADELSPPCPRADDPPLSLEIVLS